LIYKKGLATEKLRYLLGLKMCCDVMRDRNVKLVKAFYNAIAEEYDKEYETTYMRLYNEITWSNLKRYLPKKKNAVVLDAGGGTGYWAIRLAQYGYKVVLTDISDIMLKAAQRKIEQENLQQNIETRLVDIRDMSCFPSEYFDLVMAQGDPVSYCLDPEKALSELSRTVKMNGHVLISVDNKYAMIPRFIREKAFDELTEFLRTGILTQEEMPGSLVGSFRFQAFTPEELRSLFTTCGLQVVRIIGKPILTHLVPREGREKILKECFERVLSLELKFCDNPSLVGIGGHLEVVGLKASKGSS
jgi:S-adenosylmethionine-dependent methyltransferase